MVEVLSRRAPAQPYRAFEVDVLRRVRLSPSFLRVTFTGVDLDLFADCGFDQRIKLALPLPRSGLDHFPQGPDWYARWRACTSGGSGVTGLHMGVFSSRR